MDYVRERIDLIQKNILKSRTYYTGVVFDENHGEISSFDLGIFDNIKDCIDSLIIYLMSRKILIDEEWSIRPDENLASMILEILGKKKSDNEIFLKNEIERIDFLIKHTKNKEDFHTITKVIMQIIIGLFLFSKEI